MTETQQRSSTTESGPVRVDPFFGGRWRDAATEQVVNDKFTDRPATVMGCPDRAQVGEALTELVAAQRAQEQADLVGRAAQAQPAPLACHV